MSTGMVGHSYYHLGKGSALTSIDMVGNTYYHSGKGSALTSIGMVGHTYYHPRKGSALTSDHGRNQSYHHVRKALHLHLTMGGTNPTSMSERHTDSSLPLGRNLDLENTKLLPEVLKLNFDHF